MKRREFVSLLAAAAAWPLAARAQQTGARRVGVLMNLAEADPESQARIAALRDGLRRLGWIDGRNILIVSRWAAGSPERARTAADELVAMKPDAIFAGTTMPVYALQRATNTVPVVFAQIGDPVGSGVVASIAQPGGNITGFAQFEYTIGTVWMELLKQLAPTLKRVAVLFDPANQT